MKRYFVLLLITLTPFLLPAQNDDSDDAKGDFDSYRASLIENFYGSKEKIVTEFDDFRSKAIAEYVEFVRQAWSELKGESSCKRMGGNLFTHAMSAAEVQSHEVWLKRKCRGKPMCLPGSRERETVETTAKVLGRHAGLPPQANAGRERVQTHGVW